MGLATIIKQMNAKLVGTTDMGTFTESATGSLGERLTYLAARAGAGDPVPVSITWAIPTQYVPGAASSTAWPAANRAIAYPFVLTNTATVLKMWVHNGATVNGNFDIGIYDEDWVRKVSSGSTAQAGTSVLQEVDVANTALSAGRYYMALCFDGTTATTQASSISAGLGVSGLKALGWAQQAVGAVTLPDPFVPAVVASNYCPLFGASLRTLVA